MRLKPIRTLALVINVGILAACVAAFPLGPPVSAAVPAVEQQNPDRPLGVLIQPTPDWRPENPPLRRPRQSSTPPIAPAVVPPDETPPQSGAAIPGSTHDRPLGVLFNTDNSYAKPPPAPVTGSDSSLQTSPTRARPVVSPAARWTTDGRLPDRPLGLLLGPQQGVGTTPPVFPATELPPVVGQPGIISPTPDPNEKEVTTPPVSFSADTMSFDRESGIVTANGNVEVHYRDRALFADIVSYDRNTNVVRAEGNVTLLEPSGETIFGNSVEISGDLKDGVIENIGVILKDRSRIAGSGARHSSGLFTDLRNAVYSPCSLCEDDPERPPLWQIKAVKVTHDKNEKVVEYRDAWLEFFGFPVAYTPYFRHPDPTVKRKTGFLFPTFGNSSDLGFVGQFPFFWNISPHEDATITPYLMSSEGGLLHVNYRRKLRKGEVEVTGSITDNSGDGDFDSEDGKYGVRGHIDSEGRFDINEVWRWGFDAKRSTDDTYMRRYGFSAPSSLNSRLFAEAFRERSYFSASTYAFQGLRAEDVQEEIPLVLPLVDFNHIGERDRFGGRTHLDFNFLAMTRDEGTDTRRMSVHTLWERPFVGRFGDMSRFRLGLNADLYHVNSLSRGGSKEEYSGFSYRAQPIAAFDWRLPFFKKEGAITQVLEPIAAAVWSPYGGNPDDIPNEDSTEIEFDDANLFSLNRFTGIDRVEGGPRLTYGLKWGVFGDGGGKSTVFIGQAWRPRVDDTYAEGTGLEDNFSDIVARAEVSPGGYLGVGYRTRFSSDDLSPTRNEVTLSAGIPAFRVSTNYVFLDRQEDSEFSGREELNFRATSRINAEWRAGFNFVRDLDASEMRTAGIEAVYENECVIFTTRATRTFYEDRDLEPTDAITFNLVLKTIGEVHTGLTQSQ